MKKAIRILLADDHPPLRAGLAAILNTQPNFKVVAEAGSGKETVSQAAREKPDVIVLDLRMPDGDGLSALKALVEADPQTRVLILTTFDDEENVYQSLEAGARGYLLKDATKEELIEAVQRVYDGQRYLPAQVASRLADRIIRPSLSPRELDVLRLISRGRSNKEMAVAMFVSEETVKTHVKSLFAKLNVHDRTAAVAISVQRGLIRL